MDILDRFREIVRGRDAVVIECGCNNGYHTKIMRDIGVEVSKSYRHVALEPDARVLPYAWAHAGCPEVKFMEAAIAEKAGSLKLWLSNGENKDGMRYNGSSSINKPTGVVETFEGIEFSDQTNVMAVSLDHVFKVMNFDHVDFIWADVQGAEKRMIQGGLGLCLPRTRYLYTEYSNGGLYEDDASLDDIKGLLRGWEVEEDYGGDVLMVNPSVKG